MRDDDMLWERRLGIKTGADAYEKDDDHHSRYEPTAYAVLKRLADSGLIGKDDLLVDYGSGRGRVPIFMNYAVGCRTIGVEYSEALHRQAERNLASCAGRGGVRLIWERAERFDVQDASCFYFFNPFSADILNAVLGRIAESYYASPRVMRLFFYYALDPYLERLMTDGLLQYEEEIDCRDLFGGSDPREKIMVFRISPE